MAVDEVVQPETVGLSTMRKSNSPETWEVVKPVRRDEVTGVSGDGRRCG